MHLPDLAWPAVPDRPVLLVPLGSLEQHGPHLPFDADTRVAVAVAAALAGRIGEGAVVAPPLTVGASGEHQGFPGTLSIGTVVLRLALIELVRSASLWAARTVLVNGHGGNAEAGTQAVDVLRGEGHDVAWVPCGVPGGDAHAGRTETSLLLHLAPALVDLPSAAAGAVAPLGVLLPALRESGVRAVSPNGVLGDPTGASAAEGERLLAAMVDRAAARLAEQSA